MLDAPVSHLARYEEGHQLKLDSSYIEARAPMPRHRLAFRAHNDKALLVFSPNRKLSTFQDKCNFITEAEDTFRIIHPAIQPVFQYTVPEYATACDPMVAYKMPAADALLLSQAISKSNARRPVTEVHIWLLGIASALAFLEAKGFTHFNLKPEMVVLTKDRYPLLVGYGLPSVADPSIDLVEWTRSHGLQHSFYGFAYDLLENMGSPDNYLDDVPRELSLALAASIAIGAEPLSMRELEAILIEYPLRGADRRDVSRYAEMLQLADKFPFDGYMKLSPRELRFFKAGLSLKDEHPNPTPRKPTEDHYSTMVDPKRYLRKWFLKGHPKSKPHGFPRNLRASLWFDIECQRGEVNGSAPEHGSKKGERKAHTGSAAEDKKVETYLKWYSTVAQSIGVPRWYRDERALVLWQKREYKGKPNPRLFSFTDPTDPQFVPEYERVRLGSYEEEDVKFVVKSYQKGENNFVQSEESAFEYVRRLLKTQTPPFLLVLLGRMYENGTGTVQNLEKARQCYEKAGDQRHRIAVEKKIKTLAEAISAIQTTPEYIAAEQNTPLDLMVVGYRFLHGWKDFPKSQYHAKLYYQRGGEVSPDIYFVLAHCFQSGIGFSRNHRRAVKYFRRSHRGGCRRARWFDAYYSWLKYEVYDPDFSFPKFVGSFYCETGRLIGQDSSLMPALANYCGSIRCPFLAAGFAIKVKHRVSKKKGHKATRRRPGSEYFAPDARRIFALNPAANREKLGDPLNAQCFLYSVAVHRRALYKTIGFTQRAAWDDFDVYPGDPPVSLCTDVGCLTSIGNPGIILEEPRDDISSLLDRLTTECPSLRSKLDEPNKQSLIALKRMSEAVEFLEQNCLFKLEKPSLFQQFVRTVHRYEPWSTAELVFSEVVEVATSGDREKQRYVADSYFYGENGFPLNFAAASQFYKLAADQGDRESECQYAIMCAAGVGMPCSLVTAIDYYQRSKEHGNIEAMWRYALFLQWTHRGDKTEMDDLKRILELLRAANDAGSKEAAFYLGRLEESHASFYIGQVESIQYYMSAAIRGDLEALRRLWLVTVNVRWKEPTDLVSKVDYLLPYVLALNDPRMVESCFQVYQSLDRVAQGSDFPRHIQSSGDAQCLSLLASSLPDPDYLEAGQIYRKIARKRPEALLPLMELVYMHSTMPEKLQAALNCWATYGGRLSSEHENIGMLRLARFLEDQEKWAEARKIWWKLAKERHVIIAQYKIGMAFYAKNTNALSM